MSADDTTAPDTTAPEPAPEPARAPTPETSPPETSTPPATPRPASPPTTPAAATLHSLLPRLRRLEHLLTNASAPPPTPLLQQLQHLQRTLDHLLLSYPSLHELLSLHRTHPDVFAGATTAAAREKAVVLAAQAPQIQGVAGALGALRDAAVPAAAETARLVGVLPRVQRVAVRVDVLAERVAGLRARTARAVEGWWGVGVLGVNECFAEWGERVGGVERGVRRRERGAGLEG